MKTENERKDEKISSIKAAYAAAIKAGLCYDQKSLAKLIDKDPAVVSNAFKGGHLLTDKLVLNAEKILQEKGVIVSGDNASIHGDDISGKLIDEMSAQRELYARQLDAQAEIIKNLSAALSRK